MAISEFAMRLEATLQLYWTPNYSTIIIVIFHYIFFIKSVQQIMYVCFYSCFIALHIPFLCVLNEEEVSSHFEGRDE